MRRSIESNENAKMMSKRSVGDNKNTGGGVQHRKSRLQVNLDMGPIQIPKIQLQESNNPDLLCKLKLYENDAIFEEYHIKKSIDEVIKTLRIQLNKVPSSLVEPVGNNSKGTGQIKNGGNGTTCLTISIFLLFSSFMLALLLSNLI